MVFNYRGGRLVLRKPVNLGKNSYFSSQATNFGLKSFTVHSSIQKGARRFERSTFPGVCILFRSCHCEWIVSVCGVTLVALVDTDSTGVGKVGEPFKLLLQFKSTSHGSLPIVQAAASIQSNFRSSAPLLCSCVLGNLTTLPSQ